MSKGRTFFVTAKDTEGCQKLGFIGKYKVQVCPTILRLLKHDIDSEVTHWPLYGIRKFGFSSHEFFIHVGTRCKTGEGKFIFLTSEGEDIARCLSDQINQILNQGREESKWKDEEKSCQKDQLRYIEPFGKVSELTKNELKHNVQTEIERELQGMPLEGSNPTVFHSDQEQENDYYNSYLYCHLRRNEHHSMVNVYGINSSSTAPEFSKERRTDSSDYEYINF